MSCCGNHNHSEHNEPHEREEKKGISWKTALIVLIILGLLAFSSIGLMIQ